MRNFFRSIIPFFARIIPVGSFAPVTYWRHWENKHLYLCMSEKYIVDTEKSSAEQKFVELFPKGIRISQMEFDCILFFHPDMEIVTIADDNILLTIAREQDPEMTEERLDQLQYEAEHEESEDQKLLNDSIDEANSEN